MNKIQFPNKYLHFSKPRAEKPMIKKIKEKRDYKYSVYSDLDVQRMNSNIKSILQSNYPNILFNTNSESILSSNGERLNCRVDWKPTPIYVGKEEILHDILNNNKHSITEYISRRLKLKRLLKLEYFMSSISK
eukprot:NODE_247_length_12991_cov_0.678328.p8 type:complete len:133 gc:universal NODE_247_length_12991_cov_0.678328:10916-11314(+)